MPNISDKVLNDLRNNPGMVYCDEEFTEYKFVDGSLMIKPINHFNTNTNLIEWQNKIINDKHNYDVLNSLDDYWSDLRIDPEYFSRHSIKNSTPLEALDSAIDHGVYPPPEVLLALNECFQTYYSFCGKVELEDIFFGKRKKRVGNNSGRKYSKEIYKQFRFYVVMDRIEKSMKRSLEDIAIDYLMEHSPDTDLDSFLRQYRRYKKSLK